MCFKKNLSLNFCVFIETENDTNNYDEINEYTPEDIYGNVDEEIEFQTIQNPYYGGDFDDDPTQIKIVENPYYDGEL